MHESYENRLKHPADFRVKYRFYTKEEGGRKNTPAQGYRSDFWYEHPAHSGKNQLFMIWPEFENELGDVITDDKSFVSHTGTARMWILSPNWRPYHYDKIVKGLTGYFMEGHTRVAKCEVIEILGLFDNSTTQM